jgi:hypothetical protein
MIPDENKRNTMRPVRMPFLGLYRGDHLAYLGVRRLK